MALTGANSTTTLNLSKGSNPIFDYYVQPQQPVPHWIGHKWFVRVTWWTDIQKKDGSPAFFMSLVLFGHFQTYWGSAKCDATRTYMLWYGELGEPNIAYVMTGWSKEHKAFRYRSDAGRINDIPNWKSMGSS